jgi:hypothetical protein
MRRQGKTGATGARGPRGKRGAAGTIGHRGLVGKTGQQGLSSRAGALQTDDILHAVVTHFDDVYRRLNAQMREMSKIQQQVHILLGRDSKSGAKQE